MIFIETELKGAFIIDLEERRDDRGFFARTFCAKEFEEHGLKPTVAQCNLSFNHKKVRCGECIIKLRQRLRQN